MALALAGAMVPAHRPASAQALPTGLTVVHGQASVATAGDRMTVTNSSGAILNWQSFSIGARQGVHFQQPDVASKVLNRVVGNDPSQIFGSLSSNGQVWLLNPNGVLFGQGARVDVAGLVASTLHLADADWLAGRQHYTAPQAGAAQASVVNQGELRTTYGGRVLLLGSTVRNEGVIDASGGQVVLAAGDTVDLIDTGTPNLTLRVNAGAGQVLQQGVVRAAGGRIDMQAALVNQQGIVQADALERGPAGEIVLAASQSLQHGAQAETRANGGEGGRVTLDAGEGRAMVSGSVSAAGTEGRGGDIRLLGQEVGVLDGARIDASGRSGGGDVRIGGGLQGRDASVPNARATYVAREARIAADATEHGDGGRLIVWGTEAARVYGTFSAQGGPQGGDGGFIETSGGFLDARPLSLSAAAPAGQHGQWLLDPNDIDIITSDTEASERGTTAGPDFTTTGNSALLYDSTIAAALGQGTNVTVSTGTAEPNDQPGDIRVTGAFIGISPEAPVSLTLRAHRDIVITNSFIGDSSGEVAGQPMSVFLQAGRQVSIDSSFASVSGRVDVRATDVLIGVQSSLSSLASGDAIVLAGNDGGNLQTFFTSGGGESLSLSAPNGRWLIYAGMPGAQSFSTSGLSHDFTQYGASFGQRVETEGGIDTPAPGNGILFSFQPTASLSGAPAKVYDGSAVVSLASAQVQVVDGLVPADIAQVSSEGTGRFNDASAGTNKAYTVDAGGITFTDSQGRPVFGYALGPLAGTVSPRTLEVASVTAANKVYDGNATAPVTAGSLAGLVGDETLAVVAAGQFDTPDVGSGKPVNVSLTLGDGGNGGLASNYVLASVPQARADITPATLTYVAQPTSIPFGSEPASLSGSVSGFVGADTVGTATTGDLVFTTTARAGAPAGSYAVEGSGLNAANYVFVQDERNASALTVQPAPSEPPPSTTQHQQAARDLDMGREAVQPERRVAAPSEGRVLDATQALQPGYADHARFRSLPVDGMSDETLAAMLAARDKYKKSIFAAALAELDKNPDLANAPDCQTAKQAETGECLVTEGLKRDLVASRITVVNAQAAQGAEGAGAQVTATARAEADDAQRAAEIVAQHPPAAAPLSARAPRKVRSAALPQIERKLAVLIGIDQYGDARIPGLENAVRDASSVAGLLERELGYETVVIPNASKQAIVAALNRLAVEAGPRDSVVIYYAGHGELVPSTGLGYWQPASAAADRPQTWVSNSDIEKMLSRIGASQVALISDSCYSGSLVSGTRIRAATGEVDPDEVLRRKAVVVMSSGGNEPVFDEGKEGHSPFAWNLMRTLQQVSSWQAGGNVFERVRYAVARALPQRPQYGTSSRAGHESGADYLFEQRQLEGKPQGQ
jgi:filamentous hemagglutinin family protein